MSTIAWRVWELLTGPAAPKFGTREVAVLLIVAATLLVFRTFRERSLIAWIAAWLAYFASHHTLLSASQAGPHAVPLGHAEFVLAVTLFAAGVFIYSGSRELLTPVVVIGSVITLFAAAQGEYGANSVPLRFALELSYRLLALAAAVQVLRFRRARKEVGAWLLAAGLLLLHLEWVPVSSHLPAETGIFFDIVLGLGMLLVVFDEFRIRTRRLATLNALTTNIARAAERGPVAPDALKDLQKLMDSDAIWFRLRNGRQLTIFQQCGLSEEFLRARNSIASNDAVEATPEESRPTIVNTLKLDAVNSAVLQTEKFKQLVVAPVPGKKGLAGNLVLANRRQRSYAPDEFNFLMLCGQQLGLALENLHFVEEILRSHRQWSNTFESIQDLVLLHDSEFHILKANPALLRRVGRSQSEVVGQLCEAVLPKDDVTWKNCPYCQGEENSFFEGPDPFGGFSVASTSTYTDQGTKQKGTIHVVRDITERRSAEQKYRSLFEQLQEGAFVTTLNGKLLDCNDAFVHMLGYESRDELLGRNVESEFYVSPDQRTALRREIDKHNFVRNFEVNLKRKDGSPLAALVNSFATRDADGKVDGYQGFLLDITEKKNAEDEIRRRNRELNALNAMAVIATQSFDLDEILNLTLRQVISVLGADHGSVYLAESPNQFRRRANWGQRVSDRKKLMEANFPSGLGDLVMRSRAEVLTAEYLPHLPKAVSEFVHADPGTSIWVVLWGKDAPLGLMGTSRGQNQGYTTDDENLLVAIGRQLSTTVEKVRLYEETCKAYDDLRRAQEQLLQSEKMSAIGQLIAGVAHELNNPLTAILGYAQLLETETLESRPMEYASKIFKQAQRTHRVVQNLLSFARQRKPEKQEFEVLKVLEEALLLRDYDMKVGTIKLEREIAKGIPAVSGDPHQFEQVFLNIINNAVDAMMEEKKPEERQLCVRVRNENNSVHIEFQDSGPGLKEPHRIFEPFYTTKSVGKGTGLGLSICYGIVKEHGGEISARNAEGGGAIIEVKLPSAGHATIAEPRSVPALQKREAALGGKILVVEDEESVLDFERDVLAGTGAQVVTASSIDQMNAALKKQSFDALIINGKMPGSTGVPDSCRWVSEKWPELSQRFLLTFSSLTDSEIRNFLEQNKIPFLVKPFEVGDLIANVRKLLVKVQAAGAR